MQNVECRMQNLATRLAGFAALVLIPVVTSPEEKAAEYKTQTLRGRVVFLAEAMEEQTGVKSVPEARERILALKTRDGTLVPLLEDVRGRAFRRDERLRSMDLELVVRRYPQSPL